LVRKSDVQHRGRVVTAEGTTTSLELPRLGRVTRSTQVLDSLVAAIGASRFEPGYLPTELELSESMGVSRTTVRAALRSLEQIGLIERRQGRGTRLRSNVTPEVLALHGLMPFSTLLQQRHHVTTECSIAVHDALPPDTSERLRRSGPGYELSRVLYADAQPAVAMEEWFPVDATVRALESDDCDRLSILDLADSVFRVRIDHAVATVMAKSAGRHQQRVLGLKLRAPFLFLDETFYSLDEQPIAVSFVSVNPSFVQFSIFRQARP
jgi:GntR family transcriptional regulator